LAAGHGGEQVPRAEHAARRRQCAVGRRAGPRRRSAYPGDEPGGGRGTRTAPHWQDRAARELCHPVCRSGDGRSHCLRFRRARPGRGMAAHEAQATGTGGRGRSLSPPLAVLRARHLVFTDLDGTLLDHHTYSWAAAKEALAEIDRRRVPLILVTSKTRAELELLRRRMGHTHPFITENGGGIFIPHGYFNLHIEGAHRIAHYHCLSLSRPYAEMVAALEEIASAAGVGVVGFHQMSAREIAQNTGLALREAKLAKQRDFDEPFFFVGGEK